MRNYAETIPKRTSKSSKSHQNFLCVAVATFGETAESRGIGRSWLELTAANGRNSLKPHPEEYKDTMRNDAEMIPNRAPKSSKYH